MAKTLTDVVVANTEALERTNAVLKAMAVQPKGENTTTDEDKTKEPAGENTEPKTEEPKGEEGKPVTREEFDTLIKRIEALEEAVAKQAEETAEEVKEVVEENTKALNKVIAMFRDPSLKASFADGEAVKATHEANDTKTEKASEKWLAMKAGSAESIAFYAEHQDQIKAELKNK